MTKDEYLKNMQSRQQPIFGDEGCMKLRNAVVAQAGLGGVGGIALEMLARAGVGTFRLLDRDVFEISNLNRQLLSTKDTIGRPKVDVATERIKAINPHAVVEKTYQENVSIQNLEEMLEGADIGIAGTDSPSSDILFNQVARKKKIRLICGWTSKLSSGVWVEAHDRPEGSSKLFSPSTLKQLKRRMTGEKDPYELTEEEALALDVGFFQKDDFTPTASFSTNFAGLMTAALAIMYLTGSDTRPHSATMDFANFKMK